MTFSYLEAAFFLFAAHVVVLILHGLALGRLQAGATVGNLAPVTLPVIVNGGFLARTVDTVSDPLRVRCLDLSDGKQKLGLVVADSCMSPRNICDRIKKLANQETGFPTSQLLISATHAHSAPSLMDMFLGTDSREISRVGVVLCVAPQSNERSAWNFESQRATSRISTVELDTN